jgi:hypothetical protein
MGFLNWAKRGKPAPGKPKPTPGKARQTPPGQPSKKPPSWLADKWNKTKRVGGTAMNVATGAAVASMIPLAASRATETDIERMKSYQPQQ